MKLILLLLFGFYLFAVTWLFYLAVMSLKRNEDKLTAVSKFLAYPVVFAGYLCDVALNVLVGTVLFIEPPRELLLTDRLKRHIAKSSGWRLRFAEWFCHNLLDPFDSSGTHC